MAQYVEPEIGAFCWVELATTSDESAKKFYQGLLNWTYQSEEIPMSEGVKYVTAMAHGLPVGALFQMPKQMLDMQIPPHWGCYIRVENVDETLKKAASLGGEIVMPAMDVMEAGRMAGLKDPTGAFIHIWEKRGTAGAAVQDHKAVGTFCWNELMTKNVAAARQFYQDVFSWQFDTSEFDGKSYTQIKSPAGRPMGGMLEMVKEWGDMPPHWGVYFTIKDCAESERYVKSHGGTIGFGPHDIGDFGRFLVCADPEGAFFALFEYKN